MDNSSFRGGGPSSVPTVNEIRASLPSRPEGSRPPQESNSYNQEGQRGGRGRGRGGFRSRASSRGGLGRGRGGYVHPSAQDAFASLTRQSSRSYEPQRGCGCVRTSQHFQQTPGQAFIRQGDSNTTWSRIGNGESDTSNQRRQSGTLVEHPTVEFPEEHSASIEASNLWDIPESEAASRAEQNTDDHHTQLQVPRAFNASLHPASTPTSPTLQTSPASSTISLPAITSIALRSVAAVSLRLTRVVEEPVQAEECQFRPSPIAMEREADLLANPGGPSGPGRWEESPVQHYGDQAPLHFRHGMQFAALPPPSFHSHHYPPSTAPPPPPPPGPCPCHYPHLYQSGAPPHLYSPFPPSPSYKALDDPAFLALLMPLPRPPPRWFPIPYLEYWGPEMIADRPFYDVPIVSIASLSMVIPETDFGDCHHHSLPIMRKSQSRSTFCITESKSNVAMSL